MGSWVFAYTSIYLQTILHNIYIYIYIYFTNQVNVVCIYNHIYIYINTLQVDILGQRTDTVICSFFATNGCVYWLGVHQNIEG